MDGEPENEGTTTAEPRGEEVRRQVGVTSQVAEETGREEQSALASRQSQVTR